MEKKKVGRWKAGAARRFLGDPEAIGRRLEELREQLGRALQRRDVYEDAKNPDSPFHADVFRASPEAAEESWRLEVCGQMLRSIEYTVVVEVVDKAPVEIYVPMVTFVRGVGYEDTIRVLNDQEMRMQALSQIVEQIRAFRRKLARYQNLAEICDQLLLEAEKMTKAG